MVSGKRSVKLSGNSVTPAEHASEHRTDPVIVLQQRHTAPQMCRDLHVLQQPEHHLGAILQPDLVAWPCETHSDPSTET